jgi:hypothetical protein
MPMLTVVETQERRCAERGTRADVENEYAQPYEPDRPAEQPVVNKYAGRQVDYL